MWRHKGVQADWRIRSGSQCHRHFVRFFNVSVQATTRDQPFYTVNPTQGIRRTHSRLNPRALTGNFDMVADIKYYATLGNFWFLTVNLYMGQLRVNVRDRTAPNKPISKWISLPPKRCSQLRDLLNLGEKAYPMDKKDKWHIGGNVTITIDSDLYPCVNIRHFWVPTGETNPVPSGKGIA